MTARLIDATGRVHHPADLNGGEICFRRGAQRSEAKVGRTAPPTLRRTARDRSGTLLGRCWSRSAWSEAKWTAAVNHLVNYSCLIYCSRLKEESIHVTVLSFAAAYPPFQMTYMSVLFCAVLRKVTFQQEQLDGRCRTSEGKSAGAASSIVCVLEN